MKYTEHDVIFVKMERINGRNVVTVKDPFSPQTKRVYQTDLNRAVKSGLRVVKPVDSKTQFKRDVQRINRVLTDYKARFGVASRPYQNLAKQVSALNQFTKNKSVDRLSSSMDLMKVLQYQDYMRNIFNKIAQLPTAMELYNKKYRQALQENDMSPTWENAKKYAEDEMLMESKIDEALMYYYKKDNGLDEKDNKWVKDTMYLEENGGKRPEKHVLTLAEYHKLVEIGRKSKAYYAEHANVVSDPFRI